MIDPEPMILLQTGSPHLDFVKALHNSKQIGACPFLQIGKTVLGQPICECRAVTPAAGRVRARNPHCLPTADQQCGSDEEPIGPSLLAALFEPSPGVESFDDAVAIG
jgi:hypothetical protein